MYYISINENTKEIRGFHHNSNFDSIKDIPKREGKQYQEITKAEFTQYKGKRLVLPKYKYENKNITEKIKLLR